jgi:hypothetical protein
MAAASAIRHAVNHSIRTQFRNPHKLFFSPPTLLMSAMASDRRFSYNGLKNFNGYGNGWDGYDIDFLTVTCSQQFVQESWKNLDKVC